MSTPFWCIVASLVIVFGSKIPLAVAMARQQEGYNNRHPRDQQAKLTGWGRRAHAAHLNGFEAFAPFAAGVLMAHVGDADAGRSAILAVTFVVARLAYVVLYIADVHWLRSAMWFLALGCTIGLMVLPAIGG